MEALLQNEGIPTESIEALLASVSSPAGFQGSTVNLADVCGHTTNRPTYRPLDEAGDEDIVFEEGVHQPEKKRRLSADQVQFLERCFELENKVEPERKAQLAKDLGLKPRQVAIWFQNRRARWKTKQLERDYEALKSSYSLLKADYEQLLKEKEKLNTEVTTLADKLLFKEKKGDSEIFELNNSPRLLQKSDSDSVSEANIAYTTPSVVFRVDNRSSGDSVIFDSDSSNSIVDGVRYPLLDPTDSSNALDPDQSDLSHGEEKEEVKYCSFLRLEDHTYGFLEEDQALWLWPY